MADINVARGIAIGGTDIPDVYVWIGGAILLAIFLKLVMSWKSPATRRKDNAIAKRAADIAVREEEYKDLIEAMQPLLDLQAHLNQELKSRLERELRSTTNELKREHLERNLSEFSTMSDGRMTSIFLDVKERPGSMPVISFVRTKTLPAAYSVLGAVRHEDTEKWERGFRYLFKEVSMVEGDSGRALAYLDEAAAVSLLKRIFVLTASQLPFGFTAETFGLESGSPHEIIKANPVQGDHWPRHFAEL